MLRLGNYPLVIRHSGKIKSEVIMGKKSIKANKNVYQLCREHLELTRAQASELMDTISADRIEKIESEKSLPYPDEILKMAECYKAPELCNYFCSQECAIGQQYVPKVEIKNLSQITLETISTLNKLKRQEERFIDIAADDKIQPDELEGFVRIQYDLTKLSITVDTLQLWLEKTIANNDIDPKELAKLRKKIYTESENKE